MFRAAKHDKQESAGDAKPAAPAEAAPAETSGKEAKASA